MDIFVLMLQLSQTRKTKEEKLGSQLVELQRAGYWDWSKAFKNLTQFGMKVTSTSSLFCLSHRLYCVFMFIACKHCEVVFRDVFYNEGWIKGWVSWAAAWGAIL